MGIKLKTMKSDMGPPPLPKEGMDKEEMGMEADPLDVEFDQLWEGGSDLDPDDLERMKEYVHICLLVGC
jgi:hypothetical protein